MHFGATSFKLLVSLKFASHGENPNLAQVIALALSLVIGLFKEKIDHLVQVT